MLTFGTPCYSFDILYQLIVIITLPLLLFFFKGGLGTLIDSLSDSDIIACLQQSL